MTLTSIYGGFYKFMSMPTPSIPVCHKLMSAAQFLTAERAFIACYMWHAMIGLDTGTISSASRAEIPGRGETDYLDSLFGFGAEEVPPLGNLLRLALERFIGGRLLYTATGWDPINETEELASGGQRAHALVLDSDLDSEGILDRIHNLVRYKPGRVCDNRSFEEWLRSCEPRNLERKHAKLAYAPAIAGSPVAAEHDIEVAATSSKRRTLSNWKLCWRRVFSMQPYPRRLVWIRRRPFR
ncbi:hypothetical protein MTO96_043522 [Rhipicephalus appendiculatus]